MKKVILFLLVLTIVTVGNLHGAASTAEAVTPDAGLPEIVQSGPAGQDRFIPDIPLTRKEQNLLRAASDEFGVPYALALGLIEKETDFGNVPGDDGDSSGYMQVAEKWHRGRMERLGVENLFDPGGNFRVGLDYLSELYGKYGDWDMALTVYNMGHNPGYVTDYAKKVMSNYAHWQKLLENYI